jgi:phenolic acid decarboxylase
MSNQNILNYYGSKLDIRVDKSMFYDYEEENGYKFDLILDNSETFDFQLDSLYDFELTIREIKSII